MIEQEIYELREEVTTLRGELEKLSTLVALLEVAQNPPQFQQRPQQQYQQRYQQQAPLSNLFLFGFFWGGCEDNRKIYWIHWNTICLEKEVCGLRVGELANLT